MPFFIALNSTPPNSPDYALWLLSCKARCPLHDKLHRIECAAYQMVLEANDRGLITAEEMTEINSKCTILKRDK